MKTLESVIRYIFLVIVGFAYIIGGLLLIPFGCSRRFYRHVSPYFGDQMSFISGAKAEVQGLENLDPKESYVFVGNHQSYVDIFLIFSALGKAGMRTVFMLKKELFKIPLFGPMARQMGLVPVDRGDSGEALRAMKESAKTLKGGCSLVVFPEGTRTYDGSLQPFKRGAFLLAQATGYKIAPFVIRGTYEIFPRNKFKVNGGPCQIVFLPVIEPGGLKSRELSEKVETVIAKKYKELRKGAL